LPDGDSDEEKAEFKKLLISERSKADEENFEEALAKAFLAWNKSEVRVGHYG
jgi:amyloid beta precursor protein binding protein 1